MKIERRWMPVYLSVGSNMGDREGQIKAAAAALERDERVRDFRISTLLETEPYGYEEQDKFLMVRFLSKPSIPRNSCCTGFMRLRRMERGSGPFTGDRGRLIWIFFFTARKKLNKRI